METGVAVHAGGIGLVVTDVIDGVPVGYLHPRQKHRCNVRPDRPALRPHQAVPGGAGFRVVPNTPVRLGQQPLKEVGGPLEDLAGVRMPVPLPPLVVH